MKIRLHVVVDKEDDAIGMEKKMIVKLIALIRQCFIQMSTTYNSNLSRIFYD